MATISASTARQTLPAQLDRVAAGEEVAITRHGRVVAVLISPDSLKTRRASEAWAQADSIAELLEAARHGPLERPALTAHDADDLVEAVRAGRQQR